MCDTYIYGCDKSKSSFGERSPIFVQKILYRKVFENLKRDKSNEMLQVIVLGAIKIHVNKS